MQIQHFIFAGGGTGGHIFPALAVAEALGCSADGPRRAHVVCSQRKVDARVLAGCAHKVLPLPAQPFGLGPRTLYRCLTRWGPSVRATRQLIAQCRSGHAGLPAGEVRMVATGGFVAAPAVHAAMLDKVPLVALNIDAVPGRANRFISWRIGNRAAVLTTVAQSQPYAAGWKVISPIVRNAARPAADAATCREMLGLDRDRPVLMVTGGSLGARSVNELVLELLTTHVEVMRLAKWQVLVQTGQDSDEGQHRMVTALVTAASAAGVTLRAEPFVQQMGLWWGAATLCLSRAGAGAVAEAWASQTPTVFLPYPFHRDGHQAQNAAGLIAVGGAALVTDTLNATATLAEGTLLALLADLDRCGAMRTALAKLGPVNGAQQVAEAVQSAC